MRAKLLWLLLLGFGACKGPTPCTPVPPPDPSCHEEFVELGGWGVYAHRCPHAQHHMELVQQGKRDLVFCRCPAPTPGVDRGRPAP